MDRTPFGRSRFASHRTFAALVAAAFLIVVPAGGARASRPHQDDTFTQVSGSPNPQYRSLNVAIAALECDRSRDVSATGSMTIVDVTRHKTLGTVALGPSQYANCGDAVLNVSSLKPGKHRIEATYTPGGDQPVTQSAPAEYTQKILARKRGHGTKSARSAIPHFMKGGRFYEHVVRPGKHDQGEHGLHIPKGKFIRGLKSPPAGIFIPGGPGGAVRRAANINLYVNTANAVPTSNNPVDPSQASDGNVVVYATNEYISFSVDGGASFHAFNPGSLYSDNPDGGVCCDQVVQYVPQINRFVWLDQYWGDHGGVRGKNRYRLAVFPPSAVTAGGLSFWTYWDISAASFPALTLPFLDYPDLSVGRNYLYLSANNGKNGGVSASVIARIGLNNLANSLNLAAGPEAWRYIAGPLFFGRVAQNAGSRAYWGQNITTSSLGVSYWDESSNSWYGPYTINDYSWPNANYGITTPDGNGVPLMYTGTILGGTRQGQSDLWLAWNAGRGSGQLSWLSRPHIELVDIALPDLTLRSQRAIWNPDYAFADPGLNTSIVGDVGMSMLWGGNGRWVNFAVGDLTKSPNLVWNMTGSNVTCGCGRWGDYTNIRPAYGRDHGGFTAAGYGTNSNPTGGGGYVYDTHFVQFVVSP